MVSNQNKLQNVLIFRLWDMVGYRQIVVGLPSTEFTANVKSLKNTRKKVL
jgi:hypothetical protein